MSLSPTIRTVSTKLPVFVRLGGLRFDFRLFFFCFQVVELSVFVGFCSMQSLMMHFYTR